MISHAYANILSLILQYPKHETPGLKNLDNETISIIYHRRMVIRKKPRLTDKEGNGSHNMVLSDPASIVNAQEMCGNCPELKLHYLHWEVWWPGAVFYLPACLRTGTNEHTGFGGLTHFAGTPEKWNWFSWHVLNLNYGDRIWPWSGHTVVRALVSNPPLSSGPSREGQYGFLSWWRWPCASCCSSL